MFWYIALFIGGIYLLERYLRTLTISNYGRRYVFVTGCDTGFGFLAAQKLDRLGFNVFAGCYSEKGSDEVRKSCSSRVQTVNLDVSNSESIQSTLRYVLDALPDGVGLWGLVNNAGVVGVSGLVEVLPRETFEQVFAVNVFGMVETTKAFLPLIRQAEGRIVNTASVLGRVTATNCAPYTMSKFAVEAFSDCLRRELKKTGVSVHVIEPGMFKTNISNSTINIAAAEKMWDAANAEVKAYYGEETFTAFKQSSRQADDQFCSKATFLVPDAYIHALTSSFPRYRYLVGTDSKTIFRFLWTVPEWLSDFILTVRQVRPPGRKK